MSMASRLLLTPALITETLPAMRINREEVFGPVVSVIRAKDDEALAIANDSPFGLSSGIATTSLNAPPQAPRPNPAW